MKAYRRLRLLGTVVAAWGAASAQSLVEPQRLAAVKSAFDSASRAEHLRCEVHPVQPALTYSLQLQTGYEIFLPSTQFGGPGRSLNVFLRVTPDGREPVYFDTFGLISEGSAEKTDVDLPGSFVVGEGAYTVETVVKDNAARICSSQWRIQARRTGSERDLKNLTPPGTVRELAASGTVPAGPKIERLTFLVHAAAMTPGAAKMEPGTIRNLAESLSSLLTQLPAKYVRVVVFSLEKQAVLLSKESFRGRDVEEVKRALEQLELAVVDFKTLQTRTKKDVLSDLLAKELRQAESPSAIILMGPRTGAQTDASLDLNSQAPWFYLQYQTDGAPHLSGRGGGFLPPDLGDADRAGPLPLSMPQVQGADGIERLVRRMNGVTLPVRNPHDLAEAIHRMAPAIPTLDDPGAAPAQPAVPSTPVPGAGTDPPDPKEPTGDDDPVEVLAHLRDRVLQHARSVPNHTCVETVQRDRYEPAVGRATKSCDNLLASRRQSRLRLDTTDWLRLDVGMADGREIFSWAGAAKFEEGEIDELVTDGAFGTGPFASMLLSIFENSDPHFIFDGETALNGRRLLQYSFRVPRNESYYRVKAGREWVVTGYTGTLMVDPATSDLVRFAVRTEELSPATGVCEVNTTLDYNMVEMGHFEYLLPKATRQRFIGQDGTESENGVSFTSCREFLGESTLAFGRTTASTSESGKTPPGSVLPAGLSMSVELTTPLVLGKAAAGDRIEGRLPEALQEAKAEKPLAPAGARVFGRLTRVELKHAGSGGYTVALRWEGLEIDGEKVPLNLRPNRQLAGLKAAGRGVLQQRGMEIELPKPGEERDGIFHFPGQQTAVESGLRSSWVTITGR